MTKDEVLKLALSALDEVRQETFRLMRNGETLYAEKKVWEAIYTIKKVLAQPERTWVGLKEEEIDQGLLRSNHALQTAGAWRDGVEWAEARLKEKNNG